MMMKQIATYQINDAFKITGKGILFDGYILDGEFLTGDFIKFDFNGKLLERKIIGIGAGTIAENGKRHVGILIENTSEKEIDDLRNGSTTLKIGKIYTNRQNQTTQISNLNYNPNPTTITRIIKKTFPISNPFLYPMSNHMPP